MTASLSTPAVDPTTDNARPSLFRSKALEQYLSEQAVADGQVLRVTPPWAWALFCSILCAVVVAVVVSVVASVEITSRGRGILRTPGGVRLLHTQVAGAVAEVLVHSGQMVEAGDVLVHLDSAGVRAALLESDRRLALARATLARFIERREPLYRTRTDLLRRRIELLEQRGTSQQATIGRYEHRADSYEALGRSGIVGALARDEVAETLAQARREQISLRETLSDASLQITSIESERQSDRWRYEQEVQEAETRRNALVFSLEQTTIRAPQRGYLEAILVRPGDVTQPGVAIGKLIPAGAPTQLVAFLPEQDRAFVATGAFVRIEIDQLPYAEFGTLRGRVERVSSDLASQYEVHEALGDDATPTGAVYRVELSLTQNERARALAPQLRPGMLANARFTLRRRRLVALVLDPLRRWLR